MHHSKIFHRFFRVFIFVGLLQAVSCSKTIDQSPLVSTTVITASDATISNNEFSSCKLRSILQTYGVGNPVIAGQFTYNSAGNPVSVLFHDYSENDYYFFYDKQGRLRELRTIKYDNIYENHLYGYDANNKIVTDTSKSGWIDQGSNIDTQIFISTLTYDAQGRVIKENIRNTLFADEYEPGPLRPTRNPTYTYDNRGNLGVAGWKSSSYDNKVSIFRSHPLFQFIHRNYSMNNASPQQQYNSKGLPLSVLPGNDELFNRNAVTKAVYDCN